MTEPIPVEPAPPLRPVEELLQLLACGRVADPGCCSACDGTGCSGEQETGGMCSDCYATGHTHGPVEDLVALGDFLDAVRRAVDALGLPSLLACLRAAEETLAAVGALAEKLLHAAETGGLRHSLVAQAVAVDLCDLVNQEATPMTAVTDAEARRYDPAKNGYKLADDPRCLWGWGPPTRDCRCRFGHACFRAFGHPGECWDAGGPLRPKADRMRCETDRRPTDWDREGRAEASR